MEKIRASNFIFKSVKMKTNFEFEKDLDTNSIFD